MPRNGRNGFLDEIVNVSKSLHYALEDGQL